jgi:hypothetical protein
MSRKEYDIGLVVERENINDQTVNNEGSCFLGTFPLYATVDVTSVLLKWGVSLSTTSTLGLGKTSLILSQMRQNSSVSGSSLPGSCHM